MLPRRLPDSCIPPHPVPEQATVHLSAHGPSRGEPALPGPRPGKIPRTFHPRKAKTHYTPSRPMAQELFWWQPPSSPHAGHFPPAVLGSTMTNQFSFLLQRGKDSLHLTESTSQGTGKRIRRQTTVLGKKFQNPSFIYTDIYTDISCDISERIPDHAKHECHKHRGFPHMVCLLQRMVIRFLVLMHQCLYWHPRKEFFPFSKYQGLP